MKRPGVSCTAKRSNSSISQDDISAIYGTRAFAQRYTKASIPALTSTAWRRERVSRAGNDMALKKKISTAEVIGNDLKILREDMARLADHVGDGLSATGDDTLDEVKAQIRRVTENVNGLLSSMAERGQDAKQAVRDATTQLRGSVTNLTGSMEDSLRARPLATVGLAIGVGFLLGTTLRR
jgi:ElaB/YqjD/DUF883 family membrane-anchored ribosome-binding protein